MGQRNCFGLFAHSRKIYLEGCALADFTVHGDIAFALLHNSIHGRQPETRSLPNLLSGKERLEDLRLDAFIDAATRVAHHQNNELSGASARMPGNVVLV